MTAPYNLNQPTFPNGLTWAQVISRINSSLEMLNPMTRDPILQSLVSRGGVYDGAIMQALMQVNNPASPSMAQVSPTDIVQPTSTTVETRFLRQTKHRARAFTYNDLTKTTLDQAAEMGLRTAQSMINDFAVESTLNNKLMTALFGKVLISLDQTTKAPKPSGYMHQYVNPYSRMSHFIPVDYDGGLGGTALPLTSTKINYARMILSYAAGQSTDNPEDYLLYIPRSHESILRTLPEFSQYENIGGSAAMPNVTGQAIKPFGIAFAVSDFLPGCLKFDGKIWKEENPFLEHDDLCTYADFSTASPKKVVVGSPIIPDDQQWALMIRKTPVITPAGSSSLIVEHVGPEGGMYVKQWEDPDLNRKAMNENTQITMFHRNTLTRVREHQVVVIALRKNKIDLDQFANLPT